MPGMPMPAAPAPTTPPVPIEYSTMAKRFIGKMGEMPDHEMIYDALGVSYGDLYINQTSISRLWHYMDAFDDGQDHNGCVRHAMGSSD